MAETCPQCGELAIESIAPLSGVPYRVCPVGHQWSIGGPPADPIEHPPHYTAGEIECIDAIAAALGPGFATYCRGTVLKYIWRLEHKGGLEDAKKAAWYCQRLVEELARSAS